LRVELKALERKNQRLGDRHSRDDEEGSPASDAAVFEEEVLEDERVVD